VWCISYSVKPRCDDWLNSFSILEIEGFDLVFSVVWLFCYIWTVPLYLSLFVSLRSSSITLGLVNVFCVFVFHLQSFVEKLFKSICRFGTKSVVIVVLCRKEKCREFFLPLITDWTLLHVFDLIYLYSKCWKNFFFNLKLKSVMESSFLFWRRNCRKCRFEWSISNLCCI